MSPRRVTFRVGFVVEMNGIICQSIHCNEIYMAIGEPIIESDIGYRVDYLKFDEVWSLWFYPTKWLDKKEYTWWMNF